ncbi:hypothetical protein L873DRAFT_1560108, partial [Choiromyces venosus 120613-1]
KALGELHFHLQIPCCKPFLTSKAKHKWFLWCRRRQHWTLEDWQWRFYSDEAKVEIGMGGGYDRVWCKPCMELQDRYLHASFKGKRVSAMFWATIGY